MRDFEKTRKKIAQAIINQMKMSLSKLHDTQGSTSQKEHADLSKEKRIEGIIYISMMES